MSLQRRALQKPAKGSPLLASIWPAPLGLAKGSGVGSCEAAGLGHRLPPPQHRRWAWVGMGRGQGVYTEWLVASGRWFEARWRRGRRQCWRGPWGFSPAAAACVVYEWINYRYYYYLLYFVQCWTGPWGCSPAAAACVSHYEHMNIIIICPLHNGDDGREVLHQLLLPALYPGYDKLPRCRRYKISCRLERGLAAARHGARPRAAACCVLHPHRISALHCARSVVSVAALLPLPSETHMRDKNNS